MKYIILLALVVTHAIVGFIGFAVGIYTLPILTAPESPSEQQLSQASNNQLFEAEIVRDLKDSDALHWGEGILSVSATVISFSGELAPGPDYKLYLSPTFVESEADFERLKHTMVNVGDVNTFRNFIVTIPDGIDPTRYNSAIVWCESFGEFITSAKYQ